MKRIQPVRASTLRVFGDLAKRTELTLSSIAARLEDEASDVRHAAIDALVAFGDGVNSARIGAITAAGLDARPLFAAEWFAFCILSLLFPPFLFIDSFELH
jgi:HEAT repeat